MNVKEVEIWKDIPNYEGYYQASDKGRVRSLDRTVTYSNGRESFYKGRILKGNVNKDGYRQTTLRDDGIGRSFMSSQLVAMAFLDHEPNGHTMVVDHINGDKSDDRVENLRIVSHRTNLSTCFRSDRSSLSSEYVGVYWDEKSSKWQSQIQHDGAKIYLGLYNTEVEASNAYQLALSRIKDGSFNSDDYKPKFTSEYKGVTFCKASNKWQAQIRMNSKVKYLGLFQTELEAHQAYLQAEKENNLSTP